MLALICYTLIKYRYQLRVYWLCYNMNNLDVLFWHGESLSL